MHPSVVELSGDGLTIALDKIATGAQYNSRVALAENAAIQKKFPLLYVEFYRCAGS